MGLVAVGPTRADAAGDSVASRGDLRLLVVRAAFPDRPLTQDATYFLGSASSLIDRLVDYYAEVSAGRFRIVPYLGETVVTLTRPRASYAQRTAVLAIEALGGFERQATSEADRRALRESQAVVVFFPGPGKESSMLDRDTPDPWSNFLDMAAPVAGFTEVVVVAADQAPPFSTFGVLCHEFGHLLGLPELYAPGGAMHEGIGKWGLMGQGTWVEKGTQPPHLDAWSKLRLGWVDVVTVDRTTPAVRVPAVRDEPLVVKIPAVPAKPGEYYLLENRRREGYDAALPGEGMLVWHVDETVGGFRSAQSDPAHKLLHLVEADGRGDLDKGARREGNRGDASDPWSGPSRRRRAAGSIVALAGAVYLGVALYRFMRARSLGFILVSLWLCAGLLYAGFWLRQGPVCGPDTPGMAPYAGGPARVVLRNFSPAAPVMHVDVLVAPAPEPPPGTTPAGGTRAHPPLR
jgi:immune inhibitor A